MRRRPVVRTDGGNRQHQFAGGLFLVDCLVQRNAAAGVVRRFGTLCHIAVERQAQRRIRFADCQTPFRNVHDGCRIARRVPIRHFRAVYQWDD